jgi:hypothetical protein
MDGQILQLLVDDEAEQETERADDEADEQEIVAVNRAIEELDAREIGQHEVGFAARVMRRRGGRALLRRAAAVSFGRRGGGLRPRGGREHKDDGETRRRVSRDAEHTRRAG